MRSPYAGLNDTDAYEYFLRCRLGALRCPAPEPPLFWERLIRSCPPAHDEQISRCAQSGKKMNSQQPFKTENNSLPTLIST